MNERVSLNHRFNSICCWSNFATFPTVLSSFYVQKEVMHPELVSGSGYRCYSNFLFLHKLRKESFRHTVLYLALGEMLTIQSKVGADQRLILFYTCAALPSRCWCCCSVEFALVAATVCASHFILYNVILCFLIESLIIDECNLSHFLFIQKDCWKMSKHTSEAVNSDRLKNKARKWIHRKTKSKKLLSIC